MEPKLTARIRRELGDMGLRLEALFASLHKTESSNVATIAGRVAAARDLVALASWEAGKLLVSELSDADREQAAEAARRG